MNTLFNRIGIQMYPGIDGYTLYCRRSGRLGLLAIIGNNRINNIIFILPSLLLLLLLLCIIIIANNLFRICWSMWSK